MKLKELYNKIFIKTDSLNYLYWVVTSFSILLSFIVWFLVKEQVNAKIDHHFNWEVELAEILIPERLGKYESGITRRYEHFLAGGIEFLDGKFFIGTPEWVAGVDDEIDQIHPIDKNISKAEADTILNNIMNDAISRVHDSRLSQMTSPVTISTNAGEDNGVLFLVPYYKDDYSDLEAREDNLIGILYDSFIIKNLMQGVLSISRRHVSISIRDDNYIFYNEHVASNPYYDPNPLLQKTIQIDLYGRKWLVDISTTKGFRSTESSILPNLVIIGGIIVNILLLLLFRIFAKSIRKSKGLIDQANKNLVEKEKYVSAIIDSTADGIITIDEHGIVESYNNACKRIFGYDCTEVIGKNISMLMPKPHSTRHDGYIKHCLDTGEKKIIGINREVQAKKKNGNTIPIELSVNEIILDNRRLFGGIIRDITERKQMEIMKDEFISTVNHEIRTPLTSIQGSLGLLKMKLLDKLDVKAKRLLDISYSSCERLASLVNDILDTQKMAAGKIEYNMEEIEICSLVRDVVEQVLGYAKKYEVKFKLNEEISDVYCKLDKNRFNQALTNILSNAVKFSPKSGVVTIFISRRNNKMVKVSVADNGPGISKSFREKIFQRFAQANSSSTRAKGGTGLGLNIAKSIIEAFGGTIDYKTVEGKGTTFFFFLPICNLKIKEDS